MFLSPLGPWPFFHCLDRPSFLSCVSRLFYSYIWRSLDSSASDDCRKSSFITLSSIRLITPVPKNKLSEMGRLGWIRHASKYFSHVRRIHQHLPSLVAHEFLHGNRNRQMLLFSQYLHSGCVDVTGSHSRFSTRSFHATGLRCTMEKDFYDILGVRKDASKDEIKKQFIKLAKKYHPDANKNNPAANRKFQEIRDAYETLRDPEKRAQYDEGYSQGTTQSGYATRDTEEFRNAYQGNFSDTFQKIFSEIFEHETEKIATDIQVDLALSFSEATEGCTRHLNFDAFIPCDSCDGRGYPIGARPLVCPTCRGTGKVTILPFTSTCTTCKGFGHIIKDNCKACRGSGVVEGVKEVKVTIPAGVESGDIIRVPHAGNSGGRGVHPGTLYIKLKVAKDPTFRREGVDIYVDCHISFTQAILGGKVDVPTLSGMIEVKIPKGVQPGHLVVLRGRGLPVQGGFFESYGDQYVRFCVDIPSMLNERQRALLEEFAEEECNPENHVGENWFEKVVDRFTPPKFVIEFSALLLILLVLGRIM